MTEKPPSRRDPIIARREGGVSEPRQETYSEVVAKVDTPKKGGRLTLMVIVFLVVGLVGLAGFSWQQSQAQAILQQRFDDLAAKIDSTDESLNQSGAALSIKLADQQTELSKHWSEIKKLWGVSNDRNKKSIDALKSATAGLKKNYQTLSKTTASNKASQKKLAAQVNETGGASLATAARIDEVDELLGKFAGAQQQASKAMERKQLLFESRLRANERAIESIDAFRKQTNQTLDRLQQNPAIL